MNHGSASSRPRAAVAGFLAAIAVAALLTSEGVKASEIEMDFSAQRPGSATAMTLDIRYRRGGDGPQDKPPAIRALRIDAPVGTRFDRAATPTCEADDNTVMLEGPSACPRESRLGIGEVTVVTGFGSPADPIVSPTPVYNDGSGWLEISQDPSRSFTIAVTRLRVDANRISGSIAAAPGGPPDGESSVSRALLRFPADTGYVTTPSSCPPSGKWEVVGRFTFSDGTTEVARGVDRCVRPPKTPRGRCARSLSGTARADYLRGSLGGDRIRGRAGADGLRGADGRDCVLGGTGRDRIHGGRGADHLAGGTGRDYFSAGPGSDVIRARDGEADRVRCGGGRDRVQSDRVDRLVNCESGSRH